MTHAFDALTGRCAYCESASGVGPCHPEPSEPPEGYDTPGMEAAQADLYPENHATIEPPF